jgi:hypothetical protein
LLRGIFTHKQEKDNILSSLKITGNKRKIIDEFSKNIEKFIFKLRDRDIKPIAIIAISIPNGLLKDYYRDKFVSGKDYCKSARYHYGEGIFKLMQKDSYINKSRVIFLDINNNYLKDLKRHFKRIIVLNQKLEVL